MNHIRVTRSFVAADALAAVIAAEYDLSGPVECKLFSKVLTTQDNDHYKVTTSSGEKYVARIYQFGGALGRKESDYQYELDWLNFLKRRELPVSYPLARKNGSFLGSVNAPEGLRYFALFSFAGGKAMSLDDPEQLYQCGREMARIHVASNDFTSRFERKAIDLDFLVDNPVATVQRFWDAEDEDMLDVFLTSAAEAKEEILELLRNEEHTPDGWGPIGGDFHARNTHFDENGQLTFFNFDLCGPGWRAYDIAAFLLNTNLMHSSEELSEAFFAGYYSVRQMSQNEHAAVSPFLTLRRVWLTGMFTMSEGMAGHTFVAPARAPR